MSRARTECAIVSEKQIERLMRKYLGLESSNLTDDEREILLFALYMESFSSGGIGAKATAEGDARVAEAKAKLDAIIAADAPQAQEQPK